MIKSSAQLNSQSYVASTFGPQKKGSPPEAGGKGKTAERGARIVTCKVWGNVGVKEKMVDLLD